MIEARGAEGDLPAVGQDHGYPPPGGDPPHLGQRHGLASGGDGLKERHVARITGEQQLVVIAPAQDELVGVPSEAGAAASRNPLIEGDFSL